MDNRDERMGVALSNCMYSDAEGRRTVFADYRWTIAVTVDPPTRGDLAAARAAAEQAAERVLDRL